MPVVLGQRRILVVPTRAGWLFGLMLCIMLAVAINYNLSLGHALVFLLAGLGLVAIGHTFRNLLHLRLTPGRPEPVFAGETARFPVFVENTRNQHRHAVDLAFGANTLFRLDEIPAGEQVLALIPCPAPRRGRLDPGPITVATRFPLGLFRARSRMRPPLSCVVYPKPLASPLPRRVAAFRGGAQPGTGGQEDFAGLRERQANESLCQVAWKAVARDAEGRPLLVKQFDGGTTEDLWLDWTLTPANDTESRLSLLAGWIVAAERDHLRYGLRLAGREIRPGQGPAHRHACLEALAFHGA